MRIFHDVKPSSPLRAMQANQSFCKERADTVTRPFEPEELNKKIPSLITKVVEPGISS